MSSSIYTIIGFFALSFIAACIVAPYVAIAKKLRPLLFVALIVSLWAGDKPQPVVTVKDIEIKSYECDHTGCRMSWARGTNVVVGVDKFIIQRAERQIPARTRWSDYRDYDETYATNWATATPQHAQDVRFRVIVRKEMP